MSAEREGGGRLGVRWCVCVGIKGGKGGGGGEKGEQGVCVWRCVWVCVRDNGRDDGVKD
jgi:hypothetical protein